VLAVLTKRKTVSEVCRAFGVSQQTFARWRELALAGIDDGLRDKTAKDGEIAELERKLHEAERTIGHVALENDLLGKASRRLT